MVVEEGTPQQAAVGINLGDAGGGHCGGEAFEPVPGLGVSPHAERFARQVGQQVGLWPGQGPDDDVAVGPVVGDEAAEEVGGRGSVGDGGVRAGVVHADAGQAVGESLRGAGQKLPGEHAGAQGPGGGRGQVDAEAGELGGEETRVEGGVVGDEDAVVEKRGELGGDPGKPWGADKVGGGDAVDVGVVDVAVRLDEGLPGALDGEVFVEKDDTDLDDAVRGA